MSNNGHQSLQTSGPWKMPAYQSSGDKRCATPTQGRSWSVAWTKPNAHSCTRPEHFLMALRKPARVFLYLLVAMFG